MQEVSGCLPGFRSCGQLSVSWSSSCHRSQYKEGYDDSANGESSAQARIQASDVTKVELSMV